MSLYRLHEAELYKLHTDFKCVNFEKNVWLIFKQYGQLILITI
jgi:hypothetical protein